MRVGTKVEILYSVQGAQMENRGRDFKEGASESRNLHLYVRTE